MEQKIKVSKSGDRYIARVMEGAQVLSVSSTNKAGVAAEVEMHKNKFPNAKLTA